MKRRFNPLNRADKTRDKLHKWKQTKDVASFNADFQRILMDIPDITPAESMDRYKRGLKNYLWEALCLKHYTSLEDMMTDALTVESVKKTRDHLPTRKEVHYPANQKPPSGPTPMELGSVQLVKLTPEERQKCMRDGLCLRC